MVAQEGPENNIASTFAFDLKVSSCSCYIIFGPPGGASTFALRLMLLPPLPLPIWYAWLGDDILHPVIGFLHFWICLKALCVLYMFLFSDGFILFWYGVFFLYGFIQIYSRIALKTLEFIRKWNLSFLGDLARQSFKECIFLESGFSTFLIYEILQYIF